MGRKILLHNIGEETSWKVTTERNKKEIEGWY